MLVGQEAFGGKMDRDCRWALTIQSRAPLPGRRDYAVIGLPFFRKFFVQFSTGRKYTAVDKVAKRPHGQPQEGFAATERRVLFAEKRDCWLREALLTEKDKKREGAEVDV